MYEFQDDGIAFLRDNPRALLGDEPGLGKSRQLLLAAVPPVLVVAPAMVLDGGVWQDEHKRWTPDLDLRAVSYHSLVQREKTGKGTGTRPLPVPKPEFAGPWGTVILDEAHHIKGRKVAWSLAVGKIKTDRLWMATGTPITNYAFELWSLLRYLWPKDRRFTSYWRWVNTWFRTWQPPWGGTQIQGLHGCTPACKGSNQCEHWVEFNQQNLGDRFLQRLRDDVLTDLPPMTKQDILCPMTPKQASAYKALKRDFITWVDGHEVVAWSKAGLLTKLAKLGTGVASVTGDSDRPDYAGSGKMAQLRSQLDSRGGRPTMVVGHFRTTCDQVEAVCRDLKLEYVVVTGATSKAQRLDAMHRFQAGEVPVLVGSMVLAEGLTLTAADTVIMVEHSWRPSTNQQIVRRVHRIGQTRPVNVIHLRTPDTLDDRMVKVLATKTDQQMRALKVSDFVELV